MRVATRKKRLCYRGCDAAWAVLTPYHQDGKSRPCACSANLPLGYAVLSVGSWAQITEARPPPCSPVSLLRTPHRSPLSRHCPVLACRYEDRNTTPCVIYVDDAGVVLRPRGGRAGTVVMIVVICVECGLKIPVKKVKIMPW